jgi:hypothetical protein
VADPYAATQVLPRGAAQRALSFESLEEAADAQVGDRITAIERQITDIADEQMVISTLAQDVIRRQGRVELSLDTLTGFVKTNCGMVESLLGHITERSEKRRYTEATVALLVVLGFALSIATLIKVY